jgi:hypothetical protein
MDTTLDRDREFTSLIHNVARRNVQKTVVTDRLPVVFGGISLSLVCRIAFHNRSIELCHQIFDQVWLQKMMSARLACGNFHGNFSLQSNAEGIIDVEQSLRGDILREIYVWFHCELLLPFCSK